MSLMSVEEAGNPDGAPMLLVHGFLSSNAQWDLNRDELGKHYRLLLVELPGHGQSDAPDEHDSYAIERLVDELEAIRERHSVDTWWVCGQSLGGAISILYALAAPDRVRGLVFTNTRAAFGIKREGVSANGGEPPSITSTRDLPVHPINAKRLAEPIKQRMVAAADAMSVDATNQFLARRHTWKSTDRMTELSMPVLLVNGEWESAFQPFVDQAKSRHPAHPRGVDPGRARHQRRTTRTFQRSGHLLHQRLTANGTTATRYMSLRITEQERNTVRKQNSEKEKQC